MINVAADGERYVQSIWREAGQRGAQTFDRRWIVRARFAQQLDVALVAAEDGVRQVEEDDGGADEADE